MEPPSPGRSTEVRTMSKLPAVRYAECKPQAQAYILGCPSSTGGPRCVRTLHLEILQVSRKLSSGLSETGGAGGKRRCAAGGGCSEPLSRQRPDWRARSGRESAGATMGKVDEHFIAAVQLHFSDSSGDKMVIVPIPLPSGELLEGLSAADSPSNILNSVSN